MVVIEEMQVDGIPLIHLVQQEKKNEELPFIIFEHGFMSVKEKNLHYAFLLAKKGFRVVLPSALYHGERGAGHNELEMNFLFWEIVLRSIDELQIIKDYFEKEGMVNPKVIGVAGTSMGGLVTLGGLTKYPWIKAAVCLMGMPSFSRFFHAQLAELKKNGVTLPLSDEELKLLTNKIDAADLSKQPEKLAGRPLLFWHGKQDKVVPFSFTYEFYEEIKPSYAQYPEKLQFMVDENAGHVVSWAGVLKLVQWFENYLLSPNVTHVTTGLSYK